LILSFLADFSKISENEIEFKINGYRTIESKISMESIGADDIPLDSLQLYYQIYEWLYKGGNIYDKIVIVRNIVTLNVEKNGISLKKTTFDSIKSNFNIFERKNVEQYISLRNNVAKQLRIYQREILGAIEEFEKDFKTILGGYLTFLFTTVVIRVLAKQVENSALIPDTIIVLLLLYCVASLSYYFYDRSVLDGKIRLMDKQYNDTRKFYEGLLCEKELKELFVDKRNDDGTYQAFLEERKAHFGKLWLWLNVCTIIALICILIFINH
jgi:hypothetical protein